MPNLIRHAIIKGGLVVNVINYETLQSNHPAGFDSDHIAVATHIAQIGWGYTDNIFTDPSPVIATPEPAAIPAQVSMKQARLALLQQGLLATVNTAIAAMTGTPGQTAQIEWEFSSTVDRQSPLVISLTTSFGWSPTQLDELFTLAGTL